MKAPGQKLPAGYYRWIAIGVATGMAIASLLVWAAKRETKAAAAIEQRLAALRAAGEPLDAAALTKLFPPPPPELDAEALLKDAWPFVQAHSAPANTPLVTGGPDLARTQALSEQARAMLRRHYEDSADITRVIPVLPAGARFADRWSNGILATQAVSFIRIRTAAQMLATRAVYAAETGDAEGATAMLERSFRFANAVPTDSTLVSHMIREACVSLACAMTERCLNRAQFTEEQLTRIAAALPPPATNDLLGTFRVEQCMAVWAFSEVRAGKRLEEIISPRTAKPWWERMANRVWRARHEYNDRDFLTYLELIPQLNHTTKLPARAATVEAVKLFDRYSSNVTCDVAQCVLPNWRKALERRFEIEAHLEATRAALHVEHFRRVHGRLPESLGALGPLVPKDSFDGEPLRFKPLPRGFVVYSVRLDGADHGGMEKTNASLQLNYDLTVTVER